MLNAVMCNFCNFLAEFSAVLTRDLSDNEDGGIGWNIAGILQEFPLIAVTAVLLVIYCSVQSLLVHDE